MLGRLPECTIQLQSNMVSRRHAEVFLDEGKYYVKDLGSGNGTFLNGSTRQRHIANLRADGVAVHETVLGFADFETADEVFMSGNMNKVTPVTAFDDRSFQVGPVTRRVREMYWDWAASA